MDEWFKEILADLPSFLSRCTPIQRLEFQEELDRLAANGEIIVIHGRKTQGKSQYMILDNMQPPRDKEGGTDDESADTAR